MGTFQDRLASELRLAGATTCEQANQVLRRFLPRHNRRFVVSAQQPETAWVEWPKGRQMDQYFCFKYRRVVLNDNTVRIGKLVIDIPPPAKGGISYAHARVEVQERFDGSLVVYLDGHRIATKILAEPAATYRARGKSVSSEQPPTTKPEQPNVAPAGPWRPPKNHPWRRANTASALAKAEAS